jgi:molybdenum cofactor biosynthesis enzyme MoaA
LPSGRVRGAMIRIARSHPGLETLARGLQRRYAAWLHSVGTRIPAVIRPRNHRLTVAITARCNARCLGCRYGRDFMPGRELSREMMDDLIRDAAAAGFHVIRLYGGEPLLHPDLPHMVAACRDRRVQPYVTTNGMLLERRIDELHAAGLRDITVGIYGIGADYDRYVQGPGLFARVERGIATARERYGDALDIQMNWLLMRPTCSVEAFTAARDFAERYRLRMQIDLIHYSLPYFDEGPDRMLQFRPEDAPAIRAVVDELLRVKAERPALINSAPEALRSIPDWLIQGPAMRVPCTAYEMVWVGADGSVQLCYVGFPLGNLHETRFRDLVRTAARRRAARDAFLLRCPNCHCGQNDRILRHGPSRRKYSRNSGSRREDSPCAS